MKGLSAFLFIHITGAITFIMIGFFLIASSIQSHERMSVLRAGVASIDITCLFRWVDIPAGQHYLRVCATV